MQDKLGLALTISVAKSQYVPWSFLKCTIIGLRNSTCFVSCILLKLYWYNLYLLTIVYPLFQMLCHIWMLNYSWHSISLHLQGNNQWMQILLSIELILSRYVWNFFLVPILFLQQFYQLLYCCYLILFFILFRFCFKFHNCLGSLISTVDGSFSFMAYLIVHKWRIAVFPEHSSGFLNSLTVSSIICCCYSYFGIAVSGD